jgi:hypothetical protein
MMKPEKLYTLMDKMTAEIAEKIMKYGPTHIVFKKK